MKPTMVSLYHGRGLVAMEMEVFEGKVTAKAKIMLCN